MRGKLYRTREPIEGKRPQVLATKQDIRVQGHTLYGTVDLGHSRYDYTYVDADGRIHQVEATAFEALYEAVPEGGEL